jgi:hypothetical protein
MTFDIRVSLDSLFRKVKFHKNGTRMTGTLHEYQYAFSIILAQVFLKLKMFRTNFFEKIESHILSYTFCFSKTLPFVG